MITANGGPSGLEIKTHYNQTDGKLGDVVEVATDYLMAQNHLRAAWFAAFLLDAATKGLRVQPTPSVRLVVEMEFRGPFLDWLNALTGR